MMYKFTENYSNKKKGEIINDLEPSVRSNLIKKGIIKKVKAEEATKAKSAK